jgi:DNA (cytosine-5)-methyltransferase 1
MPEVPLRVEWEGEVKPPYRVPTMPEIAKARGRNGLTTVSTFSGCGGSCLGFEMAGYTPLWASDIQADARECYKRNHPGSVIVCGDIRKVTGGMILESLGVDEVDVLEGSPPCTPFTTMAGPTYSGPNKWGKEVDYHGLRQRTDDLFLEFARLLGELQPRAFVAENVSGLVKGRSKGYFKLVLGALRASGYKVQAKLLDAARLGVPQSRLRVIFVGFRDDLEIDPVHPKPLPFEYSIRDALPWVTSFRFTNNWAGHAKQVRSVRRPVSTIMSGGFGETYEIERDQRLVPEWLEYKKDDEFCELELKRLGGFPDDFDFKNEREAMKFVGLSVPPMMMKPVAEVVAEALLKVDR